MIKHLKKIYFSKNLDKSPTRAKIKEKKGDFNMTREYAKRVAKARCDCIRAAKRGLHFMLKKAEMQ